MKPFGTLLFVRFPRSWLAITRSARHAFTMEIRDALVADAAEACIVLRRSISELCGADHGNDAPLLAEWLSNKTPDNVARWIVRPDLSVLVAVAGAAMAAVGAVTDAGEIILNYICPDVRFRGIGKTVLHALEVRAAARGNSRCELVSAGTAHRFYLAAGYGDSGGSVMMFGVRSYPMSRYLPARSERP